MTILRDLEDHGLPLVALREQRRELILRLIGHSGPVPKGTIFEISALQNAIVACESVIQDLEEELKAYDRAA